MTDPRAHLRALVDAVAADAVLSVPATWLRELLGAPCGQSAAPPTAHNRPADFTVNDLAMRFGRKPCTVRLWVERGMFSGAYRLHGREWRIPAAALAQFEENARRGVTNHATSHIRPGPRSTPRLSDWRKAS
jgi:hypothetical protein